MTEEEGGEQVIDTAQNGVDSSSSTPDLEHGDLLEKLETQNRLLEEDQRCHTKIIFRSGSVPSLPDSLISADSSSSVRMATATCVVNTEVVTNEEASLEPQEKEERGGEGSGEEMKTEDLEEERSDDGRKEGGGESAEKPEEDPENQQGETRQEEERKRERSESDVSKRSWISGLFRDDNRAEGGSPLFGRRAQPAQIEEEKERTEEELWQTWSGLMKTWEESAKRQQKLIKQLVRQGIPAHLRGMAWQLLADAYHQELKQQYPLLITEVSPFERQIKRDLARTFPEHSFFKEQNGLGQESLLNVMKAYSVYDREVGYCQGSPFITGLLLMQMPEEEAFCVLVKLMRDYKLRELFKPTMADLGLCFYQLEKLVEESYPQLYMHFQALGFQTSMYASAWFLTMFASVLSLNVVFRIMDIFLVEGKEFIFKVGLALLEHSQAKLLQLDLEEVLKHFQKEMKGLHEPDPDGIIQLALKIKYNPKKMKKLEKEYLYRKERQALENTELSRLQAENAELAQRILALEKECASLADRLIQGQVTRAQEAEEMFVIKKELAKMKRKFSMFDETELEDGQEKPEINGAGEGEDGRNSVEGGGELDADVEGRLEDKEKQVLKLQEHVYGKKTQQLLKDLGVATFGPSTGVILEESSPPSHRKNSHRSSTSGSPDSSSHHDSSSKKSKLKSKIENLTKELAEAKTYRAVAETQLEQNNMELKQALQRESLVLRELQSAKQYIASLEQKLAEVQMEKLQCPHCSLQPAHRHSTGSFPGHDPNSSQVLFSSLRAMWNSTAAANGTPRSRGGYGDDG